MSALLQRHQPVPVEPLTAEEVVDRLTAVRRNGEGRWMAKCPAHGDRTASLSVRAGDDGRVLLHCFGGCEFREIVAALGIDPRQLFPPRLEPWRPTKPRPDPLAATRALHARLKALYRPVAPERLRVELAMVGKVILGGTAAVRNLPSDFTGATLRCFPLRLLLQAAQEIAKQGTPRRRISILAASREIDRLGGPGYARRNQVFLWARLAVGSARRTA